jgi:hypothetical protein
VGEECEGGSPCEAGQGQNTKNLFENLKKHKSLGHGSNGRTPAPQMECPE